VRNYFFALINLIQLFRAVQTVMHILFSTLTVKSYA